MAPTCCTITQSNWCSCIFTRRFSDLQTSILTSDPGAASHRSGTRLASCGVRVVARLLACSWSVRLTGLSPSEELSQQLTDHCSLSVSGSSQLKQLGDTSGNVRRSAQVRAEREAVALHSQCGMCSPRRQEHFHPTGLECCGQLGSQSQLCLHCITDGSCVIRHGVLPSLDTMTSFPSLAQ